MVEGRKKQQWIILLLILFFIGVLFFVVSNLLKGGGGNLLVSGQSVRVDTRIIGDRTSGASPEDIWIGTANQRVQELKEENEVLRLEIRQANEKLEEKLGKMQLAIEAGISSKIDTLTEETAESYYALKGMIDGVPSGQPAQDPSLTPQAQPTDVAALATGDPQLDEFVFGSNTRVGAANQPAPVNPNASTPASANGELTSQPFRKTFTLTAKPEPSGAIRRKTLSSYVPAGSYAPAIVLTGAEAKTGTQNAAAPVPVVIKITGPAVGPSDGSRSSHIDLTGCRATGSAIGELSSERVSVRLDSLSCVRGSQVIEASIAAYVSGNGQQGVRGRLYSRAGPAVSNAAIAAALEGLGGAIGGTGTTVIGSDGAGASDILKTAPLTAGAGAVQGAASKLADYYIDRAEEISPVVSLYAGTTINIVFLEGADLSGEQ